MPNIFQWISYDSKQYLTYNKYLTIITINTSSTGGKIFRYTYVYNMIRGGVLMHIEY